MKSLDDAVRFARQECVKKVQQSQGLSELMDLMSERWRGKIAACLEDVNHKLAFAGHIEPNIFHHYEIYKKIRGFTSKPREIYFQMNNSASYGKKFKGYLIHLLGIFGEIYESEKTK